CTSNVLPDLAITHLPSISIGRGLASQSFKDAGTCSSGLTRMFMTVSLFVRAVFWARDLPLAAREGCSEDCEGDLPGTLPESTRLCYKGPRVGSGQIQALDLSFGGSA